MILQHAYSIFSTIAALALFYILEQLVIYGGGLFNHWVVGLYRFALAVLVIALFTGIIDALANPGNVNRVNTLIVAALALLALTVAFTHNFRK